MQTQESHFPSDATLDLLNDRWPQVDITLVLLVFQQLYDQLQDPGVPDPEVRVPAELDAFFSVATTRYAPPEPGSILDLIRSDLDLPPDCCFLVGETTVRIARLSSRAAR